MKEFNHQPQTQPGTLEVGFAGEMAALIYLQQQGLALIVQNFRCKMGEIDLIMLDPRKPKQQTIVFVEVRLRRDNRYGGGAASITAAKRKKIIKTATLFLTQNPRYLNHPSRFDVVDIKAARQNTVALDWIPAAFSAF